jgi:hypothetical protein
MEYVSVAAGPLWESARELSLSPLTRRGDPPTPGPGEGGITTPSYWSIAGATVASLLRGTGGFNHLSECLNPFIHTGGPRRGRSFRRRPRWWRRWHGYRSVEMASYMYVVSSEYVTARLRRHWGRHWLRPVGLATVIRQVSAFLKPGTGLYGQLAWPWYLTSPLLRQRALKYVL